MCEQLSTANLLDELLEDSARIFHCRCAIFQRVFHERWLDLLGDAVGRIQLEYPNANPALVEACARHHLRPTRATLREKLDELVREERYLRARRDEAIRAYVASRRAAPEVVAA